MLRAHEPPIEMWTECLDRKASQALGVNISSHEHRENNEALARAYRRGSSWDEIKARLERSKLSNHDCTIHEDKSEDLVITFTVRCAHGAEWFAYDFDFFFGKDKKLERVVYGVSSGVNPTSQKAATNSGQDVCQPRWHRRDGPTAMLRQQVSRATHPGYVAYYLPMNRLIGQIRIESPEMNFVL